MTTVVDYSTTVPVWRLVAASWLPVEQRERAHRWIRKIPLALILLVQSFGSLRLSNTAYWDEGLYIYTGHRVIDNWFHGAPIYSNPSIYFSGSPSIYPVWAAMLDRVGGLELVRLFSLVCMLTATACIYCFTKRLFNTKAAYVAAGAFALAGPTAMLGNFATYDAMSLALLALATALGVRAAQTHSYRLIAVVGLLLALAVATKYVAALFVPVVLMAIVLTPARRKAAWTVAVGAEAVTLAILITVFATVLRPDLAGVKLTTTSRKVITHESYPQLALDVWHYAGLWLILGALGAIWLAARLHRGRLALLLLAAGIAPILSQARIHEATSLDKHMDFGLVFLVPLIGALFATITLTRVHQRLLVVGVALALVISGLATGRALFGQWSDSHQLTDLMAYSFKAVPYMHTLGDGMEPYRYQFEDSTQQWQWDSTDGPYYNGLRGEAAVRAGLAAHYWQYVYFNGNTPISRDMMPIMESQFGYTKTDNVVLHNSKWGDQTYVVWQNYTGLGK